MIEMLVGTIQNGQVILPQPANLPDGTLVTVLPVGSPLPLGIPDNEWPTDPEGIARLVARMEQGEPFEMTRNAAGEAETATSKSTALSLPHA